VTGRAGTGADEATAGEINDRSQQQEAAIAEAASAMSTSVLYGHGSPISVVYFSEEVPASNDVRLAAAVVWRAGPAARPGGLRGLLRKLRFRLGPFGLGLHLKGSEGWAAACGGEGEHMTEYHHERRIARVLGRKYPAPRDGRTLVLLVDEGAVGRPAVSVRLVTVSVQPHDRADQDGPHAVWNSALQSDPEVRAFMAELWDAG
jgi:hypothetical protein